MNILQLGADGDGLVKESLDFMAAVGPLDGTPKEVWTLMHLVICKA